MRVTAHKSWGLVLIAAALAGCSSGLKRPVVTAQAEPDAQGVQQVVVEMHSFYFKPNRVVVHAGHPVELVLRNKARWEPHNFTIEQPPLHVSAGSWLGSAHVRFTPTSPGEYKFFCHVDSHAKKGMTGTLVVIP
jgi:plastocyanin